MMYDPLLFHRMAGQILARLRNRSHGQVILITSARPGEGKTFLANELAAALQQQATAPVALVDCVGGATPSTFNYSRVSWRELLSADALDAQRLKVESGEWPTYIAQGGAAAAALFRTDSVTRALDTLRGHFGIVILDGPILRNCGALTESADGCVMVINAGETRREIVKGTLASNPIDPHKLLGAVLNRKRLYVPAWLYRRAL